jgi:hypothetical protein
VTINPFFSKRTGCEPGFVSLSRDYLFVNHLDNAYFRLIPQGIYAPSEPLIWDITDDAGWPNNALARGKNFGGGFWLPDTSKFGGNANDYTIYWEGEATCTFVGGGSWVVDTDINHTVSVSAPFGSTVFSNQGASSNSTVPALVRCHNVGLTLTDIYNIFLNTDPGGTNQWVRNFKLYRTSDAPYVSTDPLFQGTEERYRRPAKQTFVDAMPGHLRFLTWSGTSSSPAMRFTERSLPNTANWRIGTRYGVTGGTANSITVAAVAGTPASMKHGECCTTRMTTGIVSHGGTPTAISNAASGVVTATGHSFQVGDRVVHDLRFGSPTYKLHNFPCTVTAVANSGGTLLAPNSFATNSAAAHPETVTVTHTAHGLPNGCWTTIAGATTFNGINPNGSFAINVIDANTYNYAATTPATGTGSGGGTVATETHNLTYTINVNTTSFGTYANTSPTPRDYSVLYTDLQVGSGNDRTAYPVQFQDQTHAAYYGAFMIQAQDYKTFYFDKSISMLTDGAGNPIMGVWRFDGAGSPFFQDGGGQPIEYCVQLVNEINALAIEQGQTRRVNMWLNIPYNCSINGMDSDTDASNEYPVNVLGVVINGANSLPGLLYGAKCGYEYANETWNAGGVFFGANYLAFRGIFRWVGGTGGDYVSMHVLRSTLIMRQCKAAYGTNGFCSILAGQYGAGWSGIGFGTGLNGSRCAGGPFYDGDVLNTWHTRPMDNHDGFCIAPYLDPGEPYLDATGPGSWQDDVEMYNGTGAHAGSPNPTQALANFAQNVWHDAGVGASADAAVSVTAQIAAGITPMILCNYEGGPDWPTIIGSNLTGAKGITTTDQQTFMLATYQSSQYATVQTSAITQFCANPNFRNPSFLTWIGRPKENTRWCYTAPDPYGNTFVEGDGLRNNPTWAAMAARNISPTIDRFFVPLHIHAQN